MRSPYRDKAGPALTAAWDLENIMAFVSSGFGFILHWHITLPVCQDLFVDIPLLNRYFY